MRSASQLGALAKQAPPPAWRWYDDSGRAIADHGGRDSHILAAIFAATSPGATVRYNTKVACLAFRWWRELGDPWPSPRPISIRHRSILPNLWRAVRGEPLQGAKVEPFHRALVGDLGAVPLDTWMFRLLCGTERPTLASRREALCRVEQTADRLGEAPARTQAALWYQARIQVLGAQGVASYATYLPQYAAFLL